MAIALDFLERNRTVDLADDGEMLRAAAFEQFFNTRKTLCNILGICNTAGVEGTHRQLRAGFADGLCGNDADGFSHSDRASGGKVGAVALHANALLCLTGKNRADLDGFDAGIDDDIGVTVAHHLIAGNEHLAGCLIDEIFCKIAADQALMQSFDRFLAFLDVENLDAIMGTAILFADDDVLRNIDQTASQITGIRCTKSSIGQTFSGAAGRDKVFENVQTFTVVGADRHLDGTAGGVGDQSAHTGQLTNLVHESYRRPDDAT